MVVLKKIKGATLMETLVATVLVVVVFMMASLILNNLFSNQIRNNQHQLNNVIHELEYQLHNGKISLPYSTEFEAWDISIFPDDLSPSAVEILAVQRQTQRQFKKTIYAFK